jgi:hypothetical protein
MTRIFQVIVYFVILFLVVERGFAGIGTISAANPNTWKERKISVVIASIKDVHEIKATAAHPFAATLTPIATIAGNFDASAQPTLSVRFFASEISSVTQAPPEGAIVLAVIQQQSLYADEKTRSDWIASDLCPFMPENAGMVVLKDLSDPRIQETLKKIQDARLGAVPEFIRNTTQPQAATKPAGNAKN